MCRYVAYVGEPMLLSEILYEPVNGLVHQASDAMESRTRINADGFGIGWYGPDPDLPPAVFKDISPAWNNLTRLALIRSCLACCSERRLRRLTLTTRVPSGRVTSSESGLRPRFRRRSMMSSIE